MIYTMVLIWFFTFLINIDVLGNAKVD